MRRSSWWRRMGLVALVVLVGVGTVATTPGPAAATGAVSAASRSAAPGESPALTEVATAAAPEAVATQGNHTCALLANGRVKCWGYNANGEVGAGHVSNVGDGSSEMGANLPTVNLGPGRTATALAAGRNHACALLDNEQLKCWGWNAHGQLGLGDTSNRGDNAGEMGANLPAVDLGAGRTATAVTAGYNFTCALLDNGTVKCWGYNAEGELGLGSQSSRGDNASEMGDSLPAVDLGAGRTATAITSGDAHTCALLDNAQTRCWGYNAYGNLGLGDTDHRGDGANEMGDNLPAVNLGAGRTPISLSAGGHHTCALLDNAQTKCWGINEFGQLGLGNTANRGDGGSEMGDNLPPLNLGTGRTAIAISPGGAATCARLDNAETKCWGYNSGGQLGVGDISNRGDNAGEMGDALPAVDLGAGRSAASIATGGLHACAWLDDGQLKCWGANAHGQLGLGDVSNRGDNAGEMGDLLPAVNLSPAHSITVLLDTPIDTGQDFGFTGCAAPNACSSFALDHDNDPALPSSVTGASLAAGTYTVTGASVPGWTVTDISCDSGGTVDLPARKVTIQLGAEDDITCIFSVRTRSITIVQDTVPDLAQDFSFTGCLGEGCATFALDDDANPALPRSVTGEGLAPGTYTITQASLGPGWPLSSLSCDAPQTVDLANRRVTITLSALESVTCTFSVRTTSITIVQDSTPFSAQDFTFTGCLGLGCSTFALDDDADPTLPGLVTGEGLAPGTYTITQEHAPGWGVAAVSCLPGATTSSVGPQLTVVLAAGQQVFCYFNNSPSPQNDAFAAATELGQTGPQQGLVSSNDGATKEPGEPNHAGSPGGRSVWYRFVPTTTHQVSFDTCFDGFFESTLGVYTGSSVASLTAVTASSDFCYDMGSGAPPTVGMRRSFLAVAGTTYWIAVDGRTGYGALSGTFRLSWGPDVGWP